MFSNSSIRGLISQLAESDARGMGLYGTIDKKSIRAGYEQMAFRATLAHPIHVGLYWLIVYSSRDNAGAAWAMWGLIGLVLVSCARTALWRWISTSFDLQRLALWRGVFASSSVMLGAIWGLSCGRTMVDHGSQLHVMVLICVCCGIAAASAASFSFDVIGNIVFQFALIIPQAVGAVMMSDESAFSLSLSLTLYFVFMAALAAHLFRSQTELIRSKEMVESQKISLQEAHVSLAQTHEIQAAMLESVDEAFLIFDEKGVCTNVPSGKSRSLLNLIEERPHLLDVLRVPEKKREDSQGWYELLFEERLPFQDLAARGQKLIELPKKTLRLQWHPMRHENHEIRAVVLTASDVTRELNAQKSAGEARERAELILRINENKANFRSFLGLFDKTLAGLASWKPGEDLKTLKRELHTLKGAAFMFGAESLAKNVFEAEIKIRDAEPSALAASLQAATQKLAEDVFLWRHRETNLFTQLGVFDEDTIEIPKRRFAMTQKKYSIDESSTRALESFAREVTTNELGELLRNFEHHVNSTAVKLGKSVRFETAPISGPVYVPPTTYREVLRSLVHLFNNGVDHGIETPEQRLKAGKLAIGSIKVSYERAELEGKRWIRILIQDDGGGINVEAVKRSLDRRGLKVDPGAEPLDIAQRIFDDGLSTRENVSQISGQGIGMGAVRSAILKARGKIRVTQTSTSGTVFEVLLQDHSIADSLQRSS